MKEILDSIVVHAEEGTFEGAFVSNEVKGYTGKGYVTGLRSDGDFVEVRLHLPREGIYELIIRHASFEGEKRNTMFIDNVCYGQFVTKQTSSFEELKICTIQLESGGHNLKVLKEWGGIDIDCFILKLTKKQCKISPSFTLVNPNASSESRALMSYFKSIYGKKIVTGQHTAAANGPEIDHIKRITGKKPALRGFDLLSYSLKTETEAPSEHKIIEINENKGSIEKAIEWNKKHKGFVTFCWHWYSPNGGKDKAFYTENTDFDLNKALVPGTEEYTSLLADMDEIALHLKQLRDENVPVLWRPLHEADGGWFWWGARGPEAYKKLYLWMFDRYTNYHQLNNLIWVWNAPDALWYPGDQYVDIAGVDTYAPSGEHGPLKCQFEHLQMLLNNQKPIALTENGPIPDPDQLIESETSWLWYMPWYGQFVFGGSTSEEQLRKVYDHPYCISLDDLPN